MKNKYYWWVSEVASGKLVHLGAVANTALEAKWAIILRVNLEFEHAEIDLTALESIPNVLPVESLVMVFSNEGV